MKFTSIQRDTPIADLHVRVGPFWLTVCGGDEAIVGVDVGPVHSQSGWEYWGDESFETVEMPA